MVSIVQKDLCVCPSPPLHITLQLTAARGFVSLLMEDKKIPSGIIGALKWMFVQGYLCPGEKRGWLLCPLGSSRGMWCSSILTPAPLKPPGIVTPDC